MIFQSMKMSVNAILSNKLRSFLTMLGIIIGVFALVVLVSLVSGATGSITDSINSLGSNTINVYVFDDQNKPLRLDDLQALVSDNDVIGYAAPAAQENFLASGPFAQKNVNVTGTIGSYAEMMNMELESGRFIMKPDIDNNSQVVVVNREMATAVLGRTDVVGESIRLGGRSYLVIGVLADTNSSSFVMVSGGGNYQCYIPYTTLIRQSSSYTTTIREFYVAADTNENINAAEAVLTDIMNDRFGSNENYYIYNQSSIADALGEITGTLQLLLGGIAGISLLVGGIGIMNIMLVSVTERTREIGIRKAIGAGRGSIMLQFLIEALMVSLIGCLIGLGLSWVALKVIGAVASVNYGISISVAMLATGFSLAIGVIFGIYPANKAARMKPIDALRYN